MKRFALVLALGLAHWSLPAQVLAQSAVKIVVAYPPGGPNDLVARHLANAITGPLGRPVVVENRPGAAGTIGSAAVARSAPDGSTLLLQNNSVVSAPALFPAPPYDAVRDLTPITEVVSVPVVLVTSPATGIRSVDQLLALARAKPGQINFGSGGSGGGPHLVGEVFKKATGLDVVHVPYKGAAPVIADLIAGRVHYLFGDLPAFAGQLKSGRLVALAVVGKQRSALAPQARTLDELGVHGVDAASWYGLFGLAGMPQSMVNETYKLVSTALARKELADTLVAAGAIPVGSAPEAFRAFVADETAKWTRVVRESGARLN